MKKTISLILLFIVSFIAFLIYLAPAAVVYHHAQPLMGKSLKVSGITGTIWRGQAQQIVSNQQHLEHIQWQLKPMKLVLGNISATVQFGKLREFAAPYGSTELSMPLAFDIVRLVQTSIRVPANMIMNNVQLPMPLATKGNVKLKLNAAEILLQDDSKLCNQVDGQIETHNLSVQGLEGWIDFDTIEGNIGCDTGALSLAVTKSNQLGLQLEAEYTKHGAKISGFVKPDASMPKQVHDAVKFLGNPDGSGRYPIRF